MERLKDKVAVITGASSGVGKTAARMMAAEGAHLVLAARRAQALEELKKEITNNGGKVTVVPTDIADSNAVEALFQTALEVCGHIDILVNAAGVLEDGLPAIDKFKNEDLDRVLNTNAKGTLYCMREASKAMLVAGNGGSIINVASVSGLVGNGGAAYVASKGAIIAATRHAALRLNRDNIRVNSICPGSINTPMNAEAKTIPDMDLINEILLHSDIKRNPMMCEPEHVAHLIIYLASDESLPVTGQNIVMDYGVNL